MDIKKRIQELSLDQKAKLYFMGLVRQGKIDTLPEDPKAAYMDMLYKDLANVGKDTDDYGRSISGKDKSTFMEPEDSMPAARAKKMMGLEEGYNKIANKLYGVNYDKLSPQEQEYVRDTIDREPGGAFNPRLSGMDEMQTVNKETGEDITKYVLQLLQGEISKEEFEKITGLKKEARDEEDEENDRNLAVDDIPDSLREIATKLGYLEENHANQKYYKLLNVLNDKGHLHRYGVIQLQTEFGLKEKEAQEIYNQYKKDLMKEVDGMEGGVDLNAISVKKASFMYTEQGGNFYSLTLSTSDNKQIRFGRREYDEANEWLKDTLAYIHEGDLIPKKYNSGLEDLDLIVARLEELGIEASHGDYMDVS